jgi:ABC-type uncharacterized transport system permease subunit
VSTTAPPSLPPPVLPPPPEPEERGGLMGLVTPHAGGVITALLTTVLAFIVGGIVVAATGSNPLSTYRGIFNGTGLNWFFPWVSGLERENAAFNLQQTLLITTTLIFTSLAVAFAFRCGLFNIGGQGQWTVGAIVSVWVGSSWTGLVGPANIVVAIVLAALAGAVWAGIAGILKATVGAHEVITTIMLNWIAYWVGSYLFSRGGPLQNDTNPAVPISNDVAEENRLPIIWGDPVLQGLHMGLVLAIFALVAYWLILSRTTLGFRVRTVGRNPEAARYGGIGVGRSYFLAMAIAGGFAGIGGAMDMLGWQFRLGTLDVQDANLGFIGIAAALLGRNTAIGVLFASLLFGALLYGTSTRSLDPAVFEPQLAGNLATMIQALVILFIGLDLIMLYLWRNRRLPRLRLPRRRRGGPAAPRAATVGLLGDVEVTLPPAPALAARARAWAADRVPPADTRVGIGAIVLGVVAFLVAVPPLTVRQPAVPIALGLVAAAVAVLTMRRGVTRLGGIGLGIALIGGVLGAMATRSSVENLEAVFVWSALIAAMLRFATPLLFAALGGMFSERSGVVNIGLEGMLLMGAFFGVLGADKFDSWVAGVILAAVAGGALSAIHAVVSIHARADQILSGTATWFLAVGLTGYLFIDIYGASGTPGDIATIPDVQIGLLDGVPLLGAFASLNLLIWVGLILVPVSYYVVFRTPFGLRLRSVGEHPRAAETVGLSVYRIRYTAVILSGVLGGLGGAFLSIGFVDSFSQNMTAGAGFIALAALIFGNWRPKGLFLACLLFGSSSAIAQRLPVYSDSLALLFQTLPYILTLIAVAGLVARPRPPAAVGIPYERS